MSDEFTNLLEEDLTGRALSVGQIVNGRVVQINEDGVFVDIGAKSEGHLELDQITEDELRRLQVNDQIRVKILKSVNGEFKLSKKSVDYDEAWKKLQEDKDEDRELEVKVVEKVKNGYMCEAYGVVQGFTHHTNFQGRPNVGQGYKAKILDINRKQRKLVFTRRDIMDREHNEALERDYSQLMEGMVVEGVVERLSPYGAFVKITNTVTGLLHISEISFDHVKKAQDELKPGDVIPVKILAIDREKGKVSLSRKATLKDPLMTLLPGEEMDGKVESVADFGVFVKLDGGITGLVHISELSHRRFNHPNEIVKPGEEIRVKILKIQPEDRRVSLSAKACERDPWQEVMSRYTVGQRVSGKISQLLQSGAVVDLDGVYEAFVPVGEISEERIKHPKDVINEGDEVSGVILSIDTSKRRIRVSLRRSEEEVLNESRQRPMMSDAAIETDIKPSAGKVTLGDLLAGRLNLAETAKREKPEDEESPSAAADPVPPVVAETAPEEADGASEA
jgi:small subunit ribosomal protein S1